MKQYIVYLTGNYHAMKNFISTGLKIMAFLLLVLLVSNCEKLGRTGVCTGYSAEYN